jgi:hypothetical protein
LIKSDYFFSLALKSAGFGDCTSNTKRQTTRVIGQIDINKDEAKEYWVDKESEDLMDR